MAGTKVLIVEDEPMIAQDIAAILREVGYDIVGIAHSSHRALEFLAARDPDIALLDIAIEGDKSGIDLAHIINNKYKIPFVFLTSFADMDTLTQVKETIPYGYIVKPFKDKDLAPAIEVALLRKASEEKAIPALATMNEKANLGLTPTEYEVLLEIWKGKRNQEISTGLNLSINTIKTHISNLYLKFDVHNRSAIIAKVREMS